MDDPELEQFVLEKSSSSGSCSPVEAMNCSSPQLSSPYSHIYPQEPLAGLPISSSISYTAIPCSAIDSLPPISQFSSSASSPSFRQQIYAAHHEILTPKHGQTILSMDNHIAANSMFDLNGNIPEQHSAHFPDYHDLDYDEHYYQTYEHCVAEENIIYQRAHASQDGMSDSRNYPWYGTQPSCDSDESLEVEYTGHMFHDNNQRTQQFGQIVRNTQRNVSCDEGSPLPNFSVFTAELKKVSNRRGRPVTYNKPGYNFSDSDSIHSDEDERTAQSKGCRRGAKNILLWKFLLGELRKPNSNHIKWENEREGIFKFVDTAECSRLWGQMKKKKDMTFEKLSRGIRHYYKGGLMSRRDGIRLVYKFNWERVPRAFWPRRH